MQLVFELSSSCPFMYNKEPQGKGLCGDKRQHMAFEIQPSDSLSPLDPAVYPWSGSEASSLS